MLDVVLAAEIVRQFREQPQRPGQVEHVERVVPGGELGVDGVEFAKAVNGVGFGLD